MIFWGNNLDTGETLSGINELTIAYNTVYFAALVISMAIDIQLKNARMGFVFTLTVYAAAGFLVPTIEGKIFGRILTLVLLLMAFRKIEREN